MTPGARQRRRRADLLLETLLVLATLVHLVPRLGPSPPPPRIEPLRIDLATAPASTLACLPGIGAVRARAIVEDRRQNGPVPSLDALDRVRGIGPVTIERLRAAHEVRAGASPWRAVAPVASPHARSPPLPARRHGRGGAPWESARGGPGRP